LWYVNDVVHPRGKEVGMSDHNHQWPWLDLGTYHQNRCNYPPEQLLPYGGKYVAWSLDGTRILASGDTEEEVNRQLVAAGIGLNQVVGDYIDPLDEASP
jgi:hypothetical protein